MKHKSDPARWTTVEIESDPQEYREAQAVTREREATEARRNADALARRDFERVYVQHGGDPSEAGAAFDAHRNRQANEAAQEYEAARRSHWHETLPSV